MARSSSIELYRKSPTGRFGLRPAKLRSDSFRKERSWEEVTRWGADGYLARPQLIMLLGVGSDYRAFVEAFYQARHHRRASIIGGWMNAYDAEPAYRQGGPYQWDRMFEITDVSIDGTPDNAETRRFANEFSAVSPALRDQAFSFDAGTVVAQAVEQAAGGPDRLSSLHVNAAFLRRLTRTIAKDRVYGVTGPIRFNAVGQNLGSAEQGEGRLLTYVQFGGPRIGWRTLKGPAAIVGLFAARCHVRRHDP
jgi:hypothetical protein